VSLPPDSRIFVAGHRGLAGSAIVRALQRHGYRHLLTRTHAELDLADPHAVRAFFAAEKPDAVFLAAAKVGGIHANNTYPADFIGQNLAIQTSVIDAAWRAGVRDLLFLGSSCIYPRDCPQPIREEYLLTGPLEPTNRPYALAKIAGIEMCWSYNRQHGTRYIAAMPTNLYGPGDNYDLEQSHVLPALIRKCHEALAASAPSMTAWGSGRPLREFLYSDDMAEGCVHLMQNSARLLRELPAEQPPLVNVGSGSDLSIRELLERVCAVVGYRGQIVWDASRPDGTPRKLMDSSRLFALDWRPRVGLDEGIARAYQDFLTRYVTAPRN
jgi:GDP-L-fucose synthase